MKNACYLVLIICILIILGFAIEKPEKKGYEKGKSDGIKFGFCLGREYEKDSTVKAITKVIFPEAIEYYNSQRTKYTLQKQYNVGYYIGIDTVIIIHNQKIK